MKNLIDLIDYLRNKSDYEEDFKSIVFKDINKDNLSNKQFWDYFKESTFNAKFSLELGLRYNKKFILINIEEGFSSNVKDYLGISKELDKLASILNLKVSEINQKSINEISAIFNNIVNNNNYKIEKKAISIHKEIINNYLNKKYVNPTIEFIDFIFWSSLERFLYSIQKRDLESIYLNIFESNKIKINVVPNNQKKVIFSNFFNINTLASLEDINANEVYLKKDFLRLKELFYLMNHETDINEEVPIFPFFTPIEINEETRPIWNNLAKLVIFFIFTILSEKVTFSKVIDGNTYYNFTYAHDKNQKISFIDFNEKEINILFDNSKRDSLLISKDKIILIFDKMIKSNFFENIGKKESKSIRQSVILRIIKPPANDLVEILNSIEELLKYYTKQKEELFSLNLKEINSILNKLEVGIKKNFEEVTSATAKMSTEISKSLITMVSSAAVAIFTWYLKVTRENFPIPVWIFRVIFPLIGGFFVIFFMMEIISIRRGVFTQKENFDITSKSVMDLTSLPLKHIITENYKKNFNMFRLYFWIYIVFSLIMLGIILIGVPILTS